MEFANTEGQDLSCGVARQGIQVPVSEVGKWCGVDVGQHCTQAKAASACGGFTIRDAALHAAGPVGARPHSAAFHVELVVVLAAQHRCAAKTASDLKTLRVGVSTCSMVG